MNNRPSRLVIFGRHYVAVFVIMFLIGKFFDALSGMTMFPLVPVALAALMLTTLMTAIGWTVVTGGTNVLHKNDPEYQEWKAEGGRPYWDSLAWPINPTPPEDRRKGS